jgi:hypothetical protein
LKTTSNFDETSSRSDHKPSNFFQNPMIAPTLKAPAMMSQIPENAFLIPPAPFLALFIMSFSTLSPVFEKSSLIFFVAVLRDH